MEKKPGNKGNKRELPRAVREALKVEDYATRHKRLSALGRKGANVANEHRRDAIDRTETLNELAQQQDIQPPRDIVNDEGDVVSYEDYLETREQP